MCLYKIKISLFSYEKTLWKLAVFQNNIRRKRLCISLALVYSSSPLKWTLNHTILHLKWLDSGSMAIIAASLEQNWTADEEDKKPSSIITHNALDGYSSFYIRNSNKMNKNVDNFNSTRLKILQLCFLKQFWRETYCLGYNYWGFPEEMVGWIQVFILIWCNIDVLLVGMRELRQATLFMLVLICDCLMSLHWE